MTVRKFEELEIWKLAREMAKDLYPVIMNSHAFKNDFQIRGQINRSAGSIMDNIAEGFERGSRNEFVNFLSFAKGSAGEFKSQLYRAFDRSYITSQQFSDLMDRANLIGKKLGALIIYLNNAQHKGVKFKNRQAN